ncbi:lipocalin family protein [Hymenobacter sp. HDW8]|uniref:lipocalin family protein n=1 Tax=Hymenobacter sp. HDW8 TaxID=2714932 RepID=UPI00140BA9C0|nr:lipocalin family protein [Hymenobacter sp. HDW8]QIL75185.1 lipocalin family protein [Hymenobacter sp. HDW8]
MTKVRLLTALSLGTMLFASCEKQLEESPTPRATAQSSTDASLAGDWQLVAYKGIVPTPNDVRTTNIFMMLDECSKDNKLHFEATGELTELEGANICDKESKKEAKPGTWALSADKKGLTLNLGEAKEYQVTSLSASSLKLRSVAEVGKPYTELEYTR